MVREAQISKQRLNESSASERDELLAETFNLSPATLSSLRSKQVGEGVYEAATLLADRGFPKQITTHNLAAMLYENWEKPDQYKSYISSALGRRYENKQAQAEAYYDLSPTYIHFLREEVGAYEGNLLAVREQYPAFQPSDVDYTRSIRLPTSIGYEEARLLGAYAIDGSYHVNQDPKTVLQLEGSGKDWEWYQCLQDAIKAIHNLDVGILTEETVLQKPSGGEYLAQRPRIKLQSQAVTTWLYSDFEFMLAPDHRRLPDPNWPGDSHAQRQGLLAGVLAGMGRIHKGNRYETTRQSDQLLTDVATLAEQLGIEAVIQEATTGAATNATTLTFNTTAVKALVEQDLFWNPRHQQALTV